MAILNFRRFSTLRFRAKLYFFTLSLFPSDLFYVFLFVDKNLKVIRWQDEMEKFGRKFSFVFYTGNLFQHLENRIYYSLWKDAFFSPMGNNSFIPTFNPLPHDSSMHIRICLLVISFWRKVFLPAHLLCERGISTENWKWYRCSSV